MTSCQEQEERLTLHAAGALEPEEETQVRAHLESCAACRAEVEATREVLGLAALPPPSEREQALLAALPRTTPPAARPRLRWELLAAAAVVLLALGPVLLRREAPPPLPPVAVELEEEPASAFEQWALADPLAEALEDLSNPNPGESL